MIVAVRLFAVARDLAGRDVVEVELPVRSNVGQLRVALSQTVPALASLLPRMMIAVDAEYAADGKTLEGGEEVAAIPPVSGG
jgi:molybdopterin converting factor subunit 1